MFSADPALLQCPRGCMSLRLDGVCGLAVAALTSAKDDCDALRECLPQLEELMKDDDAALEFGMRGGHGKLQQLICHPDEEVQEAAARCIAVICASGCKFPVARTVGDAHHPPPPHTFRFDSFLTAPAMDADLLSSITGVTADYASLHAAECVGVGPVYARSIPAWRHKLRGQEDVGQLLWPAALPLARWMVAHRHYLSALVRPADATSGARCLEIGAGLGLNGIAAALYCRSPVVLSDFNEVVLQNMLYNTELNEPALHAALYDAGKSDPRSASLAPGGWSSHHKLPTTPLMTVVRSDWNILLKELKEQREGTASASAAAPTAASGGDGDGDGDVVPPLRGTARFDLILASDIICCDEDAHGVAATFVRHLSPGGLAILVAPPSDVRYGVGSISAALQLQGGGQLTMTSRPMNPLYIQGRYHAPDSPEMSEEEVKREAGEVAAETAAVVAGGYEHRLQLHFIRWKTATAGAEAGSHDAASS